MVHVTALRTIISADPARRRIAGIVRSLALPDCWIGAGFVRNPVWDHLHGREPTFPCSDVDIIWFDPGGATREKDRRLEAALHDLDPGVVWSVKNQARMHIRNGDAPYASSVDAMRFWPETATSVAVRQTPSGEFEVAAAYGLADLFDLVLRPTPSFKGARSKVFQERVRSKGWLRTWPLLRVVV